MSETKINLEKILEEIFEPSISPEECSTPTIDLQTAIILNPELNRIKLAMRIACEKALILASLNATCSDFYVFGSTEDEERIANYDLTGLKGIVDNTSILNTINQIE